MKMVIINKIKYMHLCLFGRHSGDFGCYQKD